MNNNIKIRYLEFGKKIALSILVLFTIGIVSWFIFRNLVLNHFINKRIASFNEQHKANLSLKKAYFTGFYTITIEDLTFIPQNNDTLVVINSIKTKLRLSSLLFGKTVVKYLEINNINLKFHETDSSNNFRFLFAKKEADTTKTTTSYALKFNHLIENIFEKIPADFRLRKFHFESTRNDYVVKMKLDSFDITSNQFNTPIEIEENNKKQSIIFSGFIDNSKRTITLKSNNLGKNKCIIPFLQDRMNLKMEYDSLNFKLDENNLKDSILTINGLASFHGLVLNQPRIASKDIFIDKGSLSFRLNIGNNYAELDSVSELSYNSLNFNPYLRYQTRPTKQLAVKITKENFKSQDLFESLPKGLFTTLEGIKTSGNLSYYIDFFVDMSQLDSLRFYSSLKPNNFKIEKFGAVNYGFVNQTFEYTAYEKGVAVKTFQVGSEAPNFTPINKIPNILKTSVLSAEDAGFYHHRGFYLDAFRESFIKNINEKRFARGGSTITMQFVKNVFLSREKTITRKLEEILIVWLIENNRLISKDRIFETYLNVIEWGPMVYGIKEASTFYFNKPVSDLNLAESIFLASIISHPKRFMASFDKSGHLKNMEEFYKLLSEKMLKRNEITEEQANTLIPDVKITGRAKDFLKKDIAPIDSTDNHDFIMQ